MRKLLEFVSAFLLAMVFVVVFVSTAYASLCSIGQCLNNDWQNAVRQEEISWTDYEILDADYNYKAYILALCQLAISDHMANHCTDPYLCDGSPTLGSLLGQRDDAADDASEALTVRDNAHDSWDYWHNEAIYQLGELGYHMAHCPYCD